MLLLELLVVLPLKLLPVHLLMQLLKFVVLPVLKLRLVLLLKLLLGTQSYMLMGGKCPLLLALPVKFYVDRWEQAWSTLSNKVEHIALPCISRLL